MTGIVRALLEERKFVPDQLLHRVELDESFFANHADILMPVIRELMKTAARPLIYKLWKRGSKNAVAALAAIKKLHDQGDPNPIHTLYQQSDLDVPTQFLKRLAWEAGLHDIPGVRAEHKPGLLPAEAGLTENKETPEGFKDDWQSGETAYFEYHCNPSHDSDHAEWWYRSLQPVTVLGIDEPGIGKNFMERGRTSGIRTYNVRFKDGFEASVFEDELLVDPKYFDKQAFCPPPPQEEINAERHARKEK